jgi:hypothetical protein
VHLVGFIIRIYRDTARSSECQIVVELDVVTLKMMKKNKAINFNS